MPNRQAVPNPWAFCVAPMMDWTTRECRVFHRTLTKHARLYTEMVTANAIIHGDKERLLRFEPQEHPVALQLGGSDPKALAFAAKVGEEFGYDEINLNCGCPSDRVQNGQFGACLLGQPALVAESVDAMRAACNIPVTVKTRLGIDDLDNDEHLASFIAQIAQAGCEVVILHARKAWLQGLSPKQNRDIPPLQYERVYGMKKAFPALNIIINGGIDNLDSALAHTQHVDGVMLGRAAYKEPYLLAEVDRLFYNDEHPICSRDEAVEALLPFIASEEARGEPVKRITRHILGLYNGRPGAKIWRRRLSQPQEGSGVEFVRHALAAVQ